MQTCRALAVLFFVLLIITHGLADKYTIPGCSSEGYIDVREDTGTTITCDGIQGWSYNIYWALSGKRIGDCERSCWLTEPNNIDFQLSRPTASRSQLRIHENFRPKALQNLRCSQRSNNAKVSCVINIIYPGKITLPAVFETDPVTWTAKSSYRVDKVYSSRNHYRCIWTQAHERNFMIETNMTDIEQFEVSGNPYWKGTCSFSWTLPTTDGNYTFFRKFVPGTSDVILSAGTVKVEHPGDPEIHCVDRPVVETGNLTCQCRLSRTKPGIPAPSLSWPGYSNSSELTLVNVSRAQNGTQYTCKLTWGPNATIVRTANHTIQLDVYGPTRVYIFSTTELYTNHKIRLVCCAEDIYPSARFRWTGVTCDSVNTSAAIGSVHCAGGCMRRKDNETLNESVCEFTSSPKDPGKNVSCTATNTYTGTLFTSATRRIDFTLPEELEATQTRPAVPAAAIAGGVGVAIAIIIVAVIVVIVLVRRNRLSEPKLSQDTESISRNTDDEFEEHMNSVYGMGDDLEESTQKPASLLEPVAEALTIPSGNTATGKSHHNTATNEGIMGLETDAEYSSIAHDLASSRATEDNDQNTNDLYANTCQQTPSASASECGGNFDNKQDALYANSGSREVDIDNAGISQEDVYSAVDKSKRSSQKHNIVSSPKSTDQTNDKGPSTVVRQQVHKPSKMHDADAASMPDGRDAELHQDTKTHSLQEVSSIGSEAAVGPTGAGERICTQAIRAARQNYENVGLSLARTPLQARPDSRDTSSSDEYNKLNLLNPHGTCRQELDPEYSHLSYL